MDQSTPRYRAAAATAVVILMSSGGLAAQGRIDRGPPPVSPADVTFITGMIPHHAQAVLMAGWAPSHGAGPAVRVLCQRIAVAQQDEIAFMRGWLRDRGQSVPEGDAGHGHAGRLMPGMLTAAQLAELDGARGAEFDRLFLTYMIMHHEGALTMVETLFGSPGAAQDEDVFKFAADVNADQTTEIDRMRTMLAAYPSGGNQP
jgi:uncharacterized protein (DUF305 family)